MPFFKAMLTENGPKWRQTISLVINANSSCLYDICYSEYKDKLHLIKNRADFTGDQCVKPVNNFGC